MKPIDPSLEQKKNILRHLRYEIRSFFLEPESPDINPSGDLKESILFRRMGHCRVLVEFFTKKPQGGKTYNDVLAEHFSFRRSEPSELFSTPDVAKRVDECFNKRLFHLTYSRLDLSEDNWCVDLAFLSVKSKTKEFIEHILSKKELTATDGKCEIDATELDEWDKLKRDIEIIPLPPLRANTSNVTHVSSEVISFRK